MARNQIDKYVSDIGGLPNWNQYVAGYDQGNVLSGRTSGSMYEGGQLATGGMRTRDQINEAWLLPEDRDYHTRWNVGRYYGHGMPQAGKYGPKGFLHPAAQDTYGAPWGWAHVPDESKRSISHWSQWYKEVNPDHWISQGIRPDYTTGRAAMPEISAYANLDYASKVGYHQTGNEWFGKHRRFGGYGSPVPGEYAAREVINWDEYDRRGKKWLAEQGKSSFSNLEDIHAYMEWDELGEQGRALKKAQAELQAYLDLQKKQEEMRKAQQPQQLTVSGYGTPGLPQGAGTTPTIPGSPTTQGQTNQGQTNQGQGTAPSVEDYWRSRIEDYYGSKGFKHANLYVDPEAGMSPWEKWNRQSGSSNITSGTINI